MCFDIVAVGIGSCRHLQRDYQIAHSAVQQWPKVDPPAVAFIAACEATKHQPIKSGTVLQRQVDDRIGSLYAQQIRHRVDEAGADDQRIGDEAVCPISRTCKLQQEIAVELVAEAERTHLEDEIGIFVLVVFELASMAVRGDDVRLAIR